MVVVLVDEEVRLRLNVREGLWEGVTEELRLQS